MYLVQNLENSVIFDLVDRGVIKRELKTKNHLSGEETNVFPVYVLAERHLQQRQSHVEGLDKVRFPSKGVIPESM